MSDESIMNDFYNLGVSAVMSQLNNEEITMAMKESCWLQVNPIQQLIEV